jgi:hypothetical protein
MKKLKIVDDILYDFIIAAFSGLAIPYPNVLIVRVLFLP